MVEELKSKVTGIKGTLILKIGGTIIEITAIKNPERDLEMEWISYEETHHVRQEMP